VVVLGSMGTEEKEGNGRGDPACGAGAEEDGDARVSGGGGLGGDFVEGKGGGVVAVT
jgi:hypothetical protein